MSRKRVILRCLGVKSVSCEGWEWSVWRWEDTVRVGSGVCGGGRIL